MPDVELRIIGKNLSKQALGELKRDVDKTARSFQEAGASAEGFGKRAKVTREGLMSLAVGAGAVAAATGLLVRSWVSAAVTLEKQRRGLIAVAGSAAAAEKQLKDLREVAKLPGLGLSEALQGSISLQAVGMSAEMAKRSLMAFGNALATVGRGREALGPVVLALTQMSAKGKIAGDDLRQIANWLPQIRRAMMDAFGTASSEAITKMGVSAEEFIERVVTEFENLPKVTGGAANAIENLRDSTTQLRASLGNVLLPAFSELLNKIASTVEWLNTLSDTQKSVISWTTASTAGVASLTAGFTGLGLALPHVKAGVLALGASLSWLAAHPVVLAGAGIAALTAALVLYAKATEWAAESTASLAKRMARMEIDRLTKDVESHREQYDVLTEALGKHILVAEKLRKKRRELLDQPGMATEEQVQKLKDVNKLILIQETKVDDLKGALRELVEAWREAREPTVEEKPVTEEEIKLERELERAAVERIEDTYKRERQMAALAYRERLADLKKDLDAKKISEQMYARAVKSEELDLQHAIAGIARKEEEDLTKLYEGRQAAREEAARREMDTRIALAEEAAQAEEEMEGARRQEHEATIAAIFAGERLRASLIEDIYERDRMLAYIDFRERSSAVQQLLATEEMSAGRRTQLEQQLRDLRLQFDKEVADSREKEAKAVEEALERQMEQAQKYGAALLSWAKRLAAPWVAIWEKAGKEAAAKQLAEIAKLEQEIDAFYDHIGEEAEEAAEGFEENMALFATTARSSLRRVGYAAEDLVFGLVDGAKRSKDAWADFGRELEVTVKKAGARIVTKGIAAGVGYMIGGPAGAAVGWELFQKGGIVPGELVNLKPAKVSVPGFQKGGIQEHPVIAAIAEGGRPEAIVPLPDGKSIPVELRGWSGAPIVVEKIEAVFPNANLEAMSQAAFERIWNKRALPALWEAIRSGRV